MKQSRAPLFWGLLLTALGVLFLIGSLGYAAYIGLWVGVMLLCAAALCGVAYARNPQRWGVLFAVTLLGMIGAGAVVDAFAPGTLAAWTGPGFLVALGAPFVAGYAVTRRWGLLIPAGFFGASAAAAIIGNLGLQAVTGGAFFFGLAAMFALLPAAGAPANAGRWAYPASFALAVVGVFAMLSSIASSEITFPLVLIAAGLFLLWRTAGHRPSST
jgi:hypothetical protein